MEVSVTQGNFTGEHNYLFKRLGLFLHMYMWEMLKIFVLFAQFPWPLCRSFKCSVFSRKNWGGKNQLARKERAKACCVGFVRVDKYKIKIQNPEAPQHITLNFIMPLFPFPFLFLPLDFRTMNLCLSEGHTFVKNCSYFVLSLSL